jgi:hypothetical protein
MGIVMILGVALVPLFIAIALGVKAKRIGCRISGWSLFTLVAMFVLLSVQPHNVAKLTDGQAFSLPGDYQDHVEYGWPAGCWRHFQDPEWNTMRNQIDLRGVAADGVFWGYYALVAMVPGGIQLIRNKRTKTAANQAVHAIGAVAPQHDG